MAKQIGLGTLFQVGDGGGPEVFTTVAQVVDITPPAENLSSVETTDMEDTVKRKIGALVDYGQGQVQLAWDPSDTGQEGLRTDLRAKTARNFKMVFPAPANLTWSFTALVTNISPAVPLEDKLTSTITLELDGSFSAIA